MADLTFDSMGKAVSGSVKGATDTLANLTNSKVLGSAASTAGKIGTSLIDGATRSATNQLSGFVGGSENLKAVESAVGSVKDSISGLLSGKTSLSEVGSGLLTGTTSAVENTLSGFVGGQDNLNTLKDTAGGLLSGEMSFSQAGDSLSGLVSGTIDKFAGGDLVASLTGSTGGQLLGMLGAKGSGDLGSDWGSMSPFLMARIYVCNAKGVADVTEFQGVYGPVAEGSFEAPLNWQSPFENTGPETKAPALTAMLQSGSLVPVLNALQAINPLKDSGLGQTIDASADRLKAAVRELEGRTGLTKLNSRQVFAGMPPVRMNFAMEFRATHDAYKEVEAPLQRLLEWVFPQELAEEGILSEVMQTARDLDSFIKAMFPSLAPKLLALTYAGKTYAPMVVESISFPLDAPKDSKGNMIAVTVQVNMATLTALDRSDIKRIFGRLGGAQTAALGGFEGVLA